MLFNGIVITISIIANIASYAALGAMITGICAALHGGITMALVLIVTLAFGLAVFLIPHCVPLDGLAAIRPGMSKEEVIGLIGPPRGFSVDSADHHMLSYWKAGRWCTVDVHLDGDDHVQGFKQVSVFHDH